VNSEKPSFELCYPLILGRVCYGAQKLWWHVCFQPLPLFTGKNLKMNALMTDTDSYCVHIPGFFSSFESYDEFSVEFNKFFRCLEHRSTSPSSRTLPPMNSSASWKTSVKTSTSQI
jgi:hypothetical protein